jgi:hypothetical protein
MNFGLIAIHSIGDFATLNNGKVSAQASVGFVGLMHVDEAHSFRATSQSLLLGI